MTAGEAEPACQPTARTAVGPVVEAVGVGKTFPGVRALDDVSIRFEPGTVHALVGENGAGKSTLIKVLAGAQRPDAGHLEIAGEQVRLSSPADSAKHGLAFIHQEPNLIDDLTVAENVLLGSTDALRARFLVDRAAMRKQYVQLVEPLGLRVKPSALVSDLGTADQTLVAIARALHKRAHFIVFDEPTAALSDVESERLFAIIGDLKNAGHTVVYVSHRLHEILRLADTISVLKDGRHVTTLPTTLVRDRDHLVSLILGKDPDLRYAAAETIGELGVHTDDEPHSADEPAAAPDASTPIAPEVPALEVVNLSDGKRVHDATFALYPGRITGMAGLVGAGRTELAAMLCGATRPQRGQLLLRGQARRFRSPRQAIRAGIALVPEDRRHLGALRELGIRENLTVPFVSRFNYGNVLPVLNRRREAKFAGLAIARLAIKVTGLDQQIATLSGGNQQKVIVSRWIGAGANVFLFDEPTQGVDVGARAEIYAVIRELANEGAAVLMISSDLEEVVEQSDDVLVMREGRVVAHLDTPDEREILRACYGHDPIRVPARTSRHLRRGRGGCRVNVTFNGHTPTLDETAWVAPGAWLVGKVTLHAEASVWYGAVLRADNDRITIGARTNLQDGSVIHVDPGHPATLGRGVSVGHRAILHGCTIDDDVLVGMGAIIMNGAHIGKNTLIGAGALIPEGTVIPPSSIVVGMPGRIRGTVTRAQVETITRNALDYVEAARAAVPQGS